MILTDIPSAYLNYNKENQEILGKTSLALAMQFDEEGRFIKGSMGSKYRHALILLKKRM